MRKVYYIIDVVFYNQSLQFLFIEIIEYFFSKRKHLKKKVV